MQGLIITLFYVALVGLFVTFILPFIANPTLQAILGLGAL